MKSWQERRDDGAGPASVQLEPEAASDTSKRARKVGLAGELPGGLEVYEESASSPLSSPPSLQTLTIKGREGGVGPYGPIPAKITKVDSQASDLHGRAPWWGWTPLQPSAKPPPRAQVSPYPNQTWCLDTPTQLGRYREGRVLVSSPTPFLGLLNSFAFKSNIFLWVVFFGWGGFVFLVSLAFLSLSPPLSLCLSHCLCVPLLSPSISLCPFGPPPLSPIPPHPNLSLVSFSICQTNFGSSAFNENKTKGS